MKKRVILLFLLVVSIYPRLVYAISTSATSSILMDMDSNRILYENNIHAVRSVASISKIMTATLAVESVKLDIFNMKVWVSIINHDLTIITFTSYQHIFHIV